MVPPIGNPVANPQAIVIKDFFIVGLILSVQGGYEVILVLSKVYIYGFEKLYHEGFILMVGLSREDFRQNRREKSFQIA